MFVYEQVRRDYAWPGARLCSEFRDWPSPKRSHCTEGPPGLQGGAHGPNPPGSLFIRLPRDPCTGKPQFQSTDSYFERERQRQFLQNPLMSQSCENTEIQQKISLLAWHNLYDFKNDCAGSSFFHLVFVNDHCLFPYYRKKNIFELHYKVF